VRLDHLLSKEQLETTVFQAPDPKHTSSAGSSGWNIDIGISSIDWVSVRLLRKKGTNSIKMSGTCTLLGPEGPDNSPALPVWG